MWCQPVLRGEVDAVGFAVGGSSGACQMAREALAQALTEP